MNERLPEPMPGNFREQEDRLMELAAKPDSLIGYKSVEAHLSEMKDRASANEAYIEGEMNKGRTAEDVLDEIGEEKAERLIGEDGVERFRQADKRQLSKEGLPDPMPENADARREIRRLLNQMRDRSIENMKQGRDEYAMLTDEEREERRRELEIDSIDEELKEGHSPKAILSDLGGYDKAVEIIGRVHADRLKQLIEQGQPETQPENKRNEGGS